MNLKYNFKLSNKYYYKFVYQSSVPIYTTELGPSTTAARQHQLGLSDWWPN